VLWDGAVRDEGQVTGQVYTLKRPLPPVALLIDRTTLAASELVAVAFAGRADTRTFGEPTFGTPVFQTTLALSDGGVLVASGAYSYDRTGRTYRGPIVPDVRVATDWSRLGTNAEPVIRAAATWLRSQSSCVG
jgi:C-terminal processing protease CtpA/Prc